MATFEAAWNLTSQVSSVIGANLPEIKMSDADLTNLEQEVDMGKLLGIVLKLVASPAVYALLWPCFAPCLYNSEKISKNTFESEETRSDFLPAVIEIFKVNVLPFIKGLSLSSITSSNPKPKSQK